MTCWRCIAFAAAAAIWLTAGASFAVAGADEDVAALITQVRALRDAGKDADALPLAEKALAIAERAFGPDSEKLVEPAVLIAGIHMSAANAKHGDWTKAESFFKRAIALREKNPNGGKWTLDILLLGLAAVYDGQKRYDDAEGLFQRYFDIVEPRIAAKTLRPDDQNVYRALTLQTGIYLVKGRIADVERRYQRMIAISEQTLGFDHPYVGVQLFQMALYVGLQRGFAAAQPFNDRFLAIAKKALADSKTDFGPSVTREDLLADLNRAAALYMASGAQDKAQEALAIVRRAREAAEPAPAAPAETGTDADVLARQADDLEKSGRAGDAVPLRKRVAALRQQALAANPRDERAQAASIASCQQLADYYFGKDLVDDAEPMFKCVLLVREMGGDKLKIAEALDNMGTAHERLGRFGEAEQDLKRAIELIEEVRGAGSTDASPLRTRVWSLMARQGRTQEAAAVATADAAANQKVFTRPPGPRNALADLDNWGAGPEARSRYSPMEWRSLEMSHKMIEMVGPDSPNVVPSLAATSELFQYSKDWANAAGHLDRAAKIMIAATKRGSLSGAAGELGGKEQVFLLLTKAGHRLAGDEPGAEAKLRDDLFVMAQWAQNSAAAGALAQMAARPRGNPALARIARERQDLSSERQEIDRGLIASISAPAEVRQRNAAKEQEQRQRLAVIDKRLDQIDADLVKQFPKYAELVKPEPLSVAGVQALLKPAEALVLFIDTPKTTFLPEETMAWVVTHEQVRWARIGLGGAAMSEAVFALRCGLDAEAWQDEGAAACEKAVKSANEDPDKPLPYDLGRAYELYRTLFGPFADAIKGKRLLIVASGPLTSLPLQALVTEKPQEGPPSWERYRGVKWLVREHAMAVLPSVSSLKALRRVARASAAKKPMVGFGNPLLDGNQKHPQFGAAYKELAQRARGKQRCPETGSQRVAALVAVPRGVMPVQTRGEFADVDFLRKQAPLPETADELCAVARDVHADQSELRLGERATEREVKRLSETGQLAQYRIAHFATHGALAGQVQGSAEPGLILTPPAEPSEVDDGYLTASEIAGLKLDADWVVLSACNTAGGEKTGAEALSGLARAFIYAGARAMLVSHWEVDSYAATMLTTRAFKELSLTPDIGPAKALQRSQLALMDDAKHPKNAHPAFWAPFVLVGEGTRNGTAVAATPAPQPAGAKQPQPAPLKPKPGSPAAPSSRAQAH